MQLNLNPLMAAFQMNYTPRVDDYVIWHTTPKPLEGWIYFISEQYVTIEIGVKCKDDENIRIVQFIRKRIVVCVFQRSGII